MRSGPATKGASVKKTTAARKPAFAKGEYYPKVDLSDFEDRPASSWSQASIRAPAAQESIQESVQESIQESIMEPPVVESMIVESIFVAPPAVEAESVSEEEEVMPSPVANPIPFSAAALQPAPSRPGAAAPMASAPRIAAADALRLPNSLDLPAARPLASQLIERRGRPTVIDASAVGQVGAQCIQVLLSAKRTWEADGVSLSIVNCAPRMLEDLTLLGIDPATFVSGELPR